MSHLLGHFLKIVALVSDSSAIGRTIGATTFSIVTFSIKGLFVTLSINDNEQKRHSA